ncbi:Ankyrin repeat-containing domain protein, partial [Elaphomyces granulatus]
LDPNLLRSRCERPPLVEAARKGDSAIVELLLAAVDINLNIGDRWYDFSALHWACKMGHVHIVKQLLTRDNVNVNAKDVYNFLPLHYGAMHTDVVKLLLQREDIDVNGQDVCGWTALTLAAHYNRFEAAKLLLERDDINPNARDIKYGWTALFHACDEEHLSMIKLLLEKESGDPNSGDDNGYTPLAHACLDPRNVDIVRSLL